MNIKELMKKPVVIEKDLTLLDAARVMAAHAANSLIVVEGAKLAGILTAVDLIRHYGEAKKISEVMSTQVISVKQTDKVQTVIDLVREKHVSIIPVIDKVGKLVGAVHLTDIIAFACDNDEFLVD